jgi:cytochrome P450
LSLPPGPGRLRTPQTTYRLASDEPGWLRRWRDEYGDPFTLHAANGAVVVTGRPELVKQIYTGSPELYLPFGVEAMTTLVGEGSLLLSSGERHKKDRKLMTPPFHGARMRAYGEGMITATRRQLAALEEGRPFVALDLTQEISMEVILRAVFGVEEVARLRLFKEVIVELVDAMHPSFMFFPVLQTELLGLSPYATFVKKKARFTALLDEEIEAARGRDREDILALLLSARYEDGEGMSQQDLRSQLMTLLLAGHETTAIGLSWALYFIGRLPEVNQKLMEELATLPEDAEPEAIAKLPYLGAVCQEALRIHPILPEVMRLLTGPMELGDYTLPAGVCVGACMVLAHSDPEIFEEPERFVPERFLPDHPKGRRYTPFEFQPFGGGHRRCIGAAFALYEMKLVLATLLREAELAVLDGELRPARRNLTLAPEGGVKMRLVRRR